MREEFRTAGERRAERLRAPPSRDRGMVAAEKYVRHAALAEHLGPRVLRMLEEPARERVVLRRSLVAERAGKEPDDRVDDGQRPRLAPAQHVVPDRELLVDPVGDALVDALVTPADEQERGFPGELLRVRLRERSPARGEEDPSRPVRRRDVFDRRDERL